MLLPAWLQCAELMCCGAAFKCIAAAVGAVGKAIRWVLMLIATLFSSLFHQVTSTAAAVWRLMRTTVSTYVPLCPDAAVWWHRALMLLSSGNGCCCTCRSLLVVVLSPVCSQVCAVHGTVCRCWLSSCRQFSTDGQSRVDFIVAFKGISIPPSTHLFDGKLTETALMLC